MLSQNLSIARQGVSKRAFAQKHLPISANPRRSIAPRAQVDLTTTWPLVRDSITQGAGFAMMAAFAQNALTSLPAKKSEHLAAKNQPMKPLQQFTFLCEKAIPEGATGTAVGIAAVFYMAQAGLSPPDAWAAAVLTGAGARGAWWLRNCV